MGALLAIWHRLHVGGDPHGHGPDGVSRLRAGVRQPHLEPYSTAGPMVWRKPAGHRQLSPLACPRASHLSAASGVPKHSRVRCGHRMDHAPSLSRHRHQQRRWTTGRRLGGEQAIVRRMGTCVAIGSAAYWHPRHWKLTAKHRSRCLDRRSSLFVGFAHHRLLGLRDHGGSRRHGNWEAAGTGGHPGEWRAAKQCLPWHRHGSAHGPALWLLRQLGTGDAILAGDAVARSRRHSCRGRLMGIGLQPTQWHLLLPRLETRCLRCGVCHSASGHAADMADSATSRGQRLSSSRDDLQPAQRLQHRRLTGLGSAGWRHQG